MPENNTDSIEIKIKFFTKWRLVFLDAANRFLFFFNLKDSKRFWGVIYDSVTKQPLDPVIVKLAYTDGYEIEQAVTDMGGRYGFLARKGKFKILPKKSNYSFPSKIVEGSRDGIYENLYHGEFFTLYEDDEVVAPSIPMDPEKFDWNQKAKLKVIATHPDVKWFFRRLFGLLFWFGFILAILHFWGTYRHAALWLYFILGLYIIVIFFAITLPEPRLWGNISASGNMVVPGNLLLELHSPDFPAVILGKTLVNQSTKFLLRANKGSYLLSISSVDGKNPPVVLGWTKVKVGSIGVMNNSLVIKSLASGPTA